MNGEAVMNGEKAAAPQYVVVRNNEQQYSIWRAERMVPAGCDVVGGPATKEDCLERIGELWTGTRP
jgi:MbtH protein